MAQASPVNPLSTALVVYHPNPFLSSLEERTDKAYKRALGLTQTETAHLSSSIHPRAALSFYLSALNSGRYEQMAAVQARCIDPQKENVLDDQYLYYDTRGLDLIGIEESSPTRVVSMVRARELNQFMRITLEVEEKKPYRIKSIQRQFVPPPKGFEIQPLSEPELLKATQMRLEEMVKKELFSGTVIIAKDGVPIFAFAGTFLNEPISLDTKFNLGSMSKMPTAIAIMQLVQKGVISLKDPLGKFLPDYPNKEVAKVTIEQLLNHMGGTGDIFGPEFAENLERLRSPQDYIKLFGERGLNFPPGTKWEYSNYGYILLGAVVEAASHQDYYEYVRENVYKPAHMTSSDSYWKTDKIPNMATGYARDFEKENPKLENNFSRLPMRGTPAGGGYSNALDELSFANALTRHQLLDKEHTEMLTANPIKTNWNDRYGYGFATSPEGVEPRWIGHSGGAEGVNSSLKIYPDSRYTVIVMTNLDKPTAERVTDFIEERMPK